MKIIDILRNQESLDVSFLNAVLLKLSDCLMSWVSLFVICKLDEVIVPFPDCHWIFVKKPLRKHLSRIGLACVFLLLFPKAILASESWDAARCADPCSSHYCKLLSI